MSFRIDPRKESGQTTIEAAFLLPLLFALFALLLQPAVILYDQCVVNAAASEACRLASTSEHPKEAAKAFVLRRLEALPQLDMFRSRGCQQTVKVDSGSGAEKTTVVVEIHLKTLPLLGMTASTLTKQAGDGCALLHAESTAALHPSWLANVDGDAKDWVGQWD